MGAKKKGAPIEGVALKFRVYVDDDGVKRIGAFPSKDGELVAQVAAIDEDLLGGSGDPAYHAWVDAVSDAFYGNIERRAGLKPGSLRPKRRKANYKNERRL